MTIRRQSPWFVLIALGLFAASHAAGQSRPAIVVPLSGERFSARLVGIDKSGAFTFETEGKPRHLSAADLVSFGAWTDGEKGPLVVLADGSVLVAGSLERLTAQSLIVSSDLWGELRLPLGSVRGIVFRPPADALARDKLLERVLIAKGDEDQLLLDNGDRVTGQLKSAPAVLGPATPDVEQDDLKSIRLETKSGPVNLAVDKLLALVFNPALVDSPRGSAAASWLGFKDGSRVAAMKLAADGGKSRISLPSGQTLSVDGEEFLDAIVSIQPLGANVTYLSDLKPAGYKHIPFLALAWSFGADKNVLGGRLRSSGSVYTKGISLHSTSRLAYRLDGRYRRFEADLALDDSAGTGGSVLYRVFVEREPGDWQSALESPIIRGGDAPLPVSIDVSGAERLALIVEFADRGDELDHANWLNARLVK